MTLFLLDAADLAHAVRETPRVRLEEFLELLALLERDRRLELVHGRLEVGVGHSGTGRVAKLREHRLRRALGREEARPNVELGLGVAQLLEGGEVGERGHALVPPARERAELARFDL